MACNNAAARSAWRLLSPGGVSVGTFTSSRRNATASACVASTSALMQSKRDTPISANRPAGCESLEKSKQHGGRRFCVGGGHGLQWIVADPAVAATHEQHSHRRDFRELHGIVTGAAGET